MYALIVVILSSVFLTSCFWPDESEDQQPDNEAQPEFPVASDEELFVLAAHQWETDELIKKAEELATKEDSDLEDKLNLANAYLQKWSLDLQERLYSDKAKKIINEVIELDHENARAYQLLGYAHEIVEEYKESEAAYLRSISLDVGDSMTQQMLAHMYWLTWDIESAKKHYGRALEFSRDVLSLSGLANILMNEWDISWASKLLEEIVQQADYVTTPKRTLSDTYSTLGLIERSQDNIDEAIKMFAKAVETDGSNDLPRTNLAHTQSFFRYFMLTRMMTEIPYSSQMKYMQQLMKTSLLLMRL